jgi:uncharacterized repeat protein (TIGR03803 family)
MKNPEGRQNSISRLVIAALAVAITFSTMMAATPSAQAQTYTVLYSFHGGPSDGQNPAGELIFDSLGNIYGTTEFGGAGGRGTVFRLDPSGKKTVLHSFAATNDGMGSEPVGRIARYQGNIYGTTSGGGQPGCRSSEDGCGTIFESSRGEVTVLHTFSPAEGAGSPGLVRDPSGNLYGTTASGSDGAPPPGCPGRGCGTVFEVSQGQERILYSFGGKPDGHKPRGNLAVDSSGNLYGTTSGGGEFDSGTVFELSPNPDSTWTEHVLYSFRGLSDGGEPIASLVIDPNGNLYGTAFSGGHYTRGCRGGCGVVFKLRQSPDGTWQEHVLYSFGDTAFDGLFPVGSLVRDRHGNLYGVTRGGGVPSSCSRTGCGIVFKVDPAGNETVLHSFVGRPTDGAVPGGGLSIDASGNLYGVTNGGGVAVHGCEDCGTVFKITP